MIGDFEVLSELWLMSVATIAAFNARSEAIVRLGSWASPALPAPTVMRALARFLITPVVARLLGLQPAPLLERFCWQSLYQASPPTSSAREKRGQGRS
jgi:hypothetical protein